MLTKSLKVKKVYLCGVGIQLLKTLHHMVDLFAA